MIPSKEPYIPDLSEPLLRALEAVFPARCYDPSSESLEAHLIYSGKVLLVEYLRRAYEEQLGDFVSASMGYEIIDDEEEHDT